jgi:hypothetical protein
MIRIARKHKLDPDDQYQRAYEQRLEELRRYSPRSHASAEQIRAEFERMESELNDYTNL